MNFIFLIDDNFETVLAKANAKVWENMKHVFLNSFSFSK